MLDPSVERTHQAEDSDPDEPDGAPSCPRRLTLPVGRFLIDLPGDARPYFGRQGFNEAGSFIQSLPVGGARAAEAMVLAQARALDIPHEEGGTQLERLAQGRRPHSWFVYFWKDTLFKDRTLEVNGYFWREGLLSIFRNACLAEPRAMAQQAERQEAMFARMRRRSLLENPPGPGFCLREAKSCPIMVMSGTLIP